MLVINLFAPKIFTVLKYLCILANQRWNTRLQSKPEISVVQELTQVFQSNWLVIITNKTFHNRSANYLSLRFKWGCELFWVYLQEYMHIIINWSPEDLICGWKIMSLCLDEKTILSLSVTRNSTSEQDEICTLANVLQTFIFN